LINFYPLILPKNPLKEPHFRFITVYTCTYPHEASLIRSLLEANGIKCFVPDENTVNVNPFYSLAIGGLRIQVDETDVENALKLLKDHEYID
jgi:hypothetical protein